MAIYYIHKELSKEVSTKSFSIVMATFFLLCALWPQIKGKEPLYYMLILSFGCLSCGFFYPRLLSPFSKIWTNFGLLLHKILNPLVMGILFFVIITPFGLILKLMNFDVLNLNLDKKSATYWIKRNRKTTGLENQF